MPANLPPQYFEAEKKYRSAKEPADKIEALEEMLAVMPKHKGTDHLKADLRRKIAQLTQTLDKKYATHRNSALVQREGAAQVVIIGMPNSGKSQLVGAITNASPAVADYPFTTQQPIPGMMKFEDIQLQLIDTPPLTEQALEWWMPNMIKRADGLLVLVDLSNDPIYQMEVIATQLKNKRIGLGKERPQEGEEILFWHKALLVGNKIDLPNAKENFNVLLEKYKEQLPVVAISARGEIGLEELKRKLYEVLDIIRVYTKAPGEKADLSDPIVLKRGSTLADAAAEVHKDFLSKLKYARLWGSGKYDGLMVKRDHILQDGDVIELHV